MSPRCSFKIIFRGGRKKHPKRPKTCSKNSWQPPYARRSSQHPARKKGSADNTPVAANFTYSGAGVAPATVTFTNTSTGATSYQWDFGDNSTSSSSSPSHTYTQGGVYTVRLTASGSAGSNSTTKTVNIATPSSAKIIGIKVASIPSPIRGGGSWDANNTGPDLYPVLADANSNALYTHSTYTPDVTPSILPLSYAFSPAYQITNFATTYKILLYDNDSPLSPDFVGGYSFTLASAAQAGYPTTYTLYVNGASTKIDLVLQWQ